MSACITDVHDYPGPFVFFFNDPATPEIYTFPYTTLFRSWGHEGTIAGVGKLADALPAEPPSTASDRKSTRLNSSHRTISYAVFCLKKKKKKYVLPEYT